MKNAEKFAAVIFSVIFLFFSCSTEINNQAMAGEENLKSITAQKEKTVQWTQELEKNRLSQKIDSIEYVNQFLKLNPPTMTAFEAGMSRPIVYPELDGFASLDISDVDANIIFLINNFCRNLAKETECDSFMNSESVFSLALFLYDAKNYGFSFKNTKWLIGKAFVLENGFEVPVRFVNENKKLDVHFYLKDVHNAGDVSQNQQSVSEYKILALEIFNFFTGKDADEK
ncbi:MAG: hypothetical protein ACI4LX_03390 [Treponema sp.]